MQAWSIGFGPIPQDRVQASAYRAARVATIGGTFEITDRAVPQPVPGRVAVDAPEPATAAVFS